MEAESGDEIPISVQLEAPLVRRILASAVDSLVVVTVLAVAVGLGGFAFGWHALEPEVAALSAVYSGRPVNAQ